MPQTNLFGEVIPEPAAPPLALAITPKNKEMLSKSQLAFNRLTKKVVALRKQIDNTSLLLEEGMRIYTEKLAPVKLKLSDHHKRCTLLMFAFYQKDTTLKNKDKRLLKEIIAQRLYCFLEPDGTVGDHYAEVYQVLHGISYDEAEDEDHQALKDEMKNMFESYGMDVDLEGLDLTDEEAMHEKINDWREKLNSQTGQHQSERKRTKKQLEAEAKRQAMDKARKQSLSSIYKQLAKVLHPDLEQDEQLRVEKEDLMKQLTVAYEAKDLHALLTLEMQWLHKSTDHIQKLSEDKLEIFNEVLREQVADLEAENYCVRHHPRFEPLIDFSTSSLGYIRMQIEREARQCQDLIVSLRGSIEALSSDKPAKEIKAILSSFRVAKRSVLYGYYDEW
jgi:hypothetical protein